MAPGHRRTASDADITLNVQGATVAKPKKPNSRQAHVPSHTSAPISSRLRRITSHQLDFGQYGKDGLIDCRRRRIVGSSHSLALFTIAATFFPSSVVTSSISPVAILAIMTALAFTSAGAFDPWGLLALLVSFCLPVSTSVALETGGQCRG